MGTNYYLVTEDGNRLHIGKSSFGWCFALHVMPWMGLNSLNDWTLYVCNNPGCVVMDEYDRIMSFGELCHLIVTKNCNVSDHLNVLHPDRGAAAEFFYESNNAQRGPNKLVRHKIGFGCVGHEANWDLIEGEFS